MKKGCGGEEKSGKWKKWGKNNDVCSGHYKQHYNIFPPVFFLVSSVVYFSHRRSAWIKNLISQKLTGAPKNLGVPPFPDPVSHFGVPGGHFGAPGGHF